MNERLQYDYSKLLNYDECLVYIKDNEDFPDTEGVIHIARVLNTPVISGETWYQLDVLTDKQGRFLETPKQMLTKAHNIVTNRATRSISPQHFYKFVTPNEDGDAPLIASGFVFTSNPDFSLSRTTRNGLGSGIYGQYLFNELDAALYKTDDSQVVYKIDVSNPYPIQDKEHSESITIASLNTNRYIDQVIQAAKPNKEITVDEILDLIQTVDITNILTLWNIVFYRTLDFILKSDLEYILAHYVYGYLNDQTLFDTILDKKIFVQPINDILASLRYNGIIGDDRYTNGWDRGCVSFQYEQANILQGSIAPYQSGLPLY